MILTEQEIRQLMDKPRNGHAITAGNALQSEHKIHITGEGYKNAVERVEGFEGKKEFNIRLQIAQPATMQITSIILDNLNRWTTAQGTVKKVDFKDKAKNDDFEKVLDQVWHGDSFDKFINTFYKDAIYTEFNGFTLATKPKIVDNMIIRDGIASPKPDGNLNPYIVFIANNDTYDFLLTGDKVEYIIIKLPEEHYRLIDDEKDIVYLWKPNATDNKIPKSGEDGYLPNEIGYVPARRISAINKKLLSAQVKTSPIDHILPALNRYFSSDADLRMQFIRHNYPKLAIVTKDCGICNGTGRSAKENKDGSYDTTTQVKCSTCDGSGRVIPISRDGVLGLPQYISNEDKAYPGSPASYITPDTDSLKLGLEDLLEQRQNIIYSGTGDKNLVSESLNTATENMINSRSLEDRIKDITKMVEDFEVFMKQAIKDLHKDFTSIEDYFIVVRYGKRISIKNEDELLKEVQDSKKAGMPASYIEALHRDLIYAKYKNNAQEMERQLLLADVEPLAGYTVPELKQIESVIYPRDMNVKVNFDAIINTIEETTPLLYFMPDAPYQDRIKAINKRIDEILQERAPANSTSGGQNVEEDDNSGTED
jgi:hypothetical protein